MTARKALVVTLVAAFLIAPLLPVAGPPRAAAAEKATISIGVIPFEEVQLTAQKFKGVVQALQEVTGKKVEWYFPTSYASLIEAQKRGFIDLGYYGPRSYIQAVEASGGKIEAFAQAAWGGGPYREKKDGYHSYIIVKADSPYQNVQQLKGKILALTDPASTSGDLVPKVMLGQELGTKLSKFFGKTFYAGKHDVAAVSVLEGRADAAAVADVTLDWAVDAKRFGPRDFRVIWKSTLLPLDPFAWHADLPADLKDNIRKAFLRLNDTDYGKAFLKSIRSESIVLTNDKAYDSIRETYAKMKDWE